MEVDRTATRIATEGGLAVGLSLLMLGAVLAAGTWMVQVSAWTPTPVVDVGCREARAVDRERSVLEGRATGCTTDDGTRAGIDEAGADLLPRWPGDQKEDQRREDE